MSYPIRYADLEDLFAVAMPAGLPALHRAAEMEAAADAREVEDFELTIDDLRHVLDEAGDPSPRAHHDESCWRKHLPCFAQRVRHVLTDHGWDE